MSLRWCQHGSRYPDSPRRQVHQGNLRCIDLNWGVIRATSSPAATALVRAIRRLAESAATPLLPADYLDLVAPLRATAQLRGRVVSVTPETRHAATVEIRPGRSWKGHLPGQYIRIGIDVDGVRHWRAYSLTSQTTSTDGLLSITVKAIPNGKVSNHIVRLLSPGTLVHLDQASGDFVLPRPLPARTLFLTAGSGITPVMGLLRNHLDGLHDVVVVHSAPTRDDVIFGDLLRDWAGTGRLRLVERYTETEGVLAPAHLDELVPRVTHRQSSRGRASRHRTCLARLASRAVDADAIGRVTIGRAAPCRGCARALPRAIIASVVIAAVRVHTVLPPGGRPPRGGTPSRSVRDTRTTM